MRHPAKALGLLNQIGYNAFKLLLGSIVIGHLSVSAVKADAGVTLELLTDRSKIYPGASVSIRYIAEIETGTTQEELALRWWRTPHKIEKSKKLSSALSRHTGTWTVTVTKTGDYYVDWLTTNVKKGILHKSRARLNLTVKEGEKPTLQEKVNATPSDLQRSLDEMMAIYDLQGEILDGMRGYTSIRLPQEMSIKDYKALMPKLMSAAVRLALVQSKLEAIQPLMRISEVHQTCRQLSDALRAQVVAIRQADKMLKSNKIDDQKLIQMGGSFNDAGQAVASALNGYVRILKKVASDANANNIKRKNYLSCPHDEGSKLYFLECVDITSSSKGE